eukprot:GHVP01032887.1.p1 GENE.GHVP01032887.1~~GHVP01032887.1.p1  ORF type:complete len:153 (+),score=25.94 GHVP01032887.1:222-680(+)
MRLSSFEDFVSQLAKGMFRRSPAPNQIEELLLKGAVQTSVLEAQNWAYQHAALYIRLCVRHNREISLTNQQFCEIFIRSFPPSVAREFRRRGLTPRLSLDEILEEASEIEAILREEIDEALPAGITYPAFGANEEEDDVPKMSYLISKLVGM